MLNMRTKLSMESFWRGLTQIKYLTMLKRLSVCNQPNKNCAAQTLNRGYPHGINSSALTDFLLINSGLRN